MAATSGPVPNVVPGLAPGRVTARAVATRARPAKAAAGTDEEAGLRQVMPRRPSAPDAASAGSAPGTAVELDITAVPVECLRRVLDGLRRLN